MLTWLALILTVWIVTSCPLAVVVGRVIAGQPARTATVVSLDAARRRSSARPRSGSAHG